jgi:hypothetical protein
MNQNDTEIKETSPENVNNILDVPPIVLRKLPKLWTTIMHSPKLYHEYINRWWEALNGSTIEQEVECVDYSKHRKPTGFDDFEGDL